MCQGVLKDWNEEKMQIGSEGQAVPKGGPALPWLFLEISTRQGAQDVTKGL
jgi:hypothetical protein